MKIQNQRGFTLIELLVTVGILAIVGFIGSSAFLSIMRVSVSLEGTKEIKQNGEYAIGTMSRMIRDANDVVSTCDGSTVSDLSIEDIQGNRTRFYCDDDTVTKIASESGESKSGNTGHLTGNTSSLGITCPGSLEFTCVESFDGPKVVTINFILWNPATLQEKFEIGSETGIPFKTTVILRNK